uniref:Putative secreted protein n=1 Tax=Anopheles triannulatus TaxID=58253 RepID=A0A2M4B6Z1_9DIPT
MRGFCCFASTVSLTLTNTCNFTEIGTSYSYDGHTSTPHTTSRLTHKLFERWNASVLLLLLFFVSGL